MIKGFGWIALIGTLIGVISLSQWFEVINGIFYMGSETSEVWRDAAKDIDSANNPNQYPWND